MNLAVDFGNTRVKAACFNGAQLVDSRIYGSVQELINDQDLFSKVHYVVMGTVTQDHLQLIDAFSGKKQLLLFQASTAIPLINNYQSASTLGPDRLAASVGAYALYPSQNVLTIDAGTCIKYNFVNDKNEYLGGAISPGIPMRLKAMHHYTNRLPLIEMDVNFNKLVGQTTAESILSGALLGAVAEVDGIINQYKEKFPNLVVVITGGDAPYLVKQLKNRIFASPELVLAGLNTILNFNLEKQN